MVRSKPIIHSFDNAARPCVLHVCTVQVIYLSNINFWFISTLHHSRYTQRRYDDLQSTRLRLTRCPNSQLDTLGLHRKSPLHCTAKVCACVGSSELVDRQRAVYFCLAIILPFLVGIQRVRNVVGWLPVLVRSRKLCCVRRTVLVRGPEPLQSAVWIASSGTFQTADWNVDRRLDHTRWISHQK